MIVKNSYCFKYIFIIFFPSYLLTETLRGRHQKVWMHEKVQFTFTFHS